MEFKLPIRPEASNKGTFGKVLNISGSKYMTGAAVLSSLAAYKSGCGYVILPCREDVRATVAAQTQTVVFVQLKNIPEFIPRVNAVLLGCGLGVDDIAQEVFDKTFESESDTPVIIDADGLNLLAQNIPVNLPDRLILTPHPKEASRLLGGVEVDEILANPEKYAREISFKYHCTTVLKSHQTLVCDEDNDIYINDVPNSALAKAGSGDVLAGIIASLVAQGLDDYNAAITGVKLHSLAGQFAREKFTEYCVTAPDLIDNLPEAFKLLLK